MLVCYRNADDVQFCVLPANKCNDLTLGLHITLIEAFCWENDIPLLKVCIGFIVALSDSLHLLAPFRGTGLFHVVQTSPFIAEYGESYHNI